MENKITPSVWHLIGSGILSFGGMAILVFVPGYGFVRAISALLFLTASAFVLEGIQGMKDLFSWKRSMTGQGTTIQIPRGEGLFWTLIYTPAALFTVVVVGLTLPATVPNKGYTQFSTVFGSLTFLVQILAESLFSVLLFTLIFRTLVLLENTFRHPQSEMITQGNSQTSKSESHHSSFPWRGVASWVLSCLIFGLLHLKTYDFNVAQAIVLIGSNLFLGFIVYLATGNYWILYISHVWGDLISFSPHCFGPVFIYGSGIILLLLGITFFGAVVFKKTSALECIGRRITLQLRSQEQYSPENGFSYQTSEDAESKNDD